MDMTTAATDAEFTNFVHAHGQRLSRTAYLLTGNPATAQDLLQETLARTFAAWDRIDPPTAHAYARRILVNLTTDRWRRKRFEPSLDPEPDRRPDLRHADPFAAVDNRSEIVAQLAYLAPRERAVLVLRFYHDLSEADTAQALGISVGTVKSTASRALAKLRSHHHEHEWSPS